MVHDEKLEIAKFKDGEHIETVCVSILKDENGLREGDIYIDEGRVDVVELCSGFWIRKAK